MGAVTATAGAQAVNDIFNRGQNKSIAAESQPFVLSTGYTYRVPTLAVSNGLLSGRLVRNVLRDWTLSGDMRYASGPADRVSHGDQHLSTVLFPQYLRQPGARRSAVHRQPQLPLCQPQQPIRAESGGVDGTGHRAVGHAAAYYNDYRYQRRPASRWPSAGSSPFGKV